MLVMLSDLHFTDGTTATNPHETAFELLGEELAATAKAKKATEINVVLLGDIFDLERSDYWHRNNVPPDKRPWGGAQLDPSTGMNPDPSVETQFNKILEAILQESVKPKSSRVLIEAIGKLKDVAGRPARVTYVIGNHDRVLNNFESLKQQVVAAFDPVSVTFDNEFRSDEYGVLARHGHVLDEHCHGWRFLTKVLKKGADIGRLDAPTYRVMAIGEVVTAELMAGLVYYAREMLPGPAHKAFINTLMEVNNLRPMTDFIRWITWLMKQQSKEYIEVSTKALRKALDGLLDSTFARRWDGVKADFIVSGDITDFLSKGRTLLRREGGVDALQKLIPIIEKIDSALDLVTGRKGKDTLVCGAEKEFSGGQLPGEIQYVVYGHSHGARQDCFSATREGRVQMYINTGTFLPVIERVADKQSFARSYRMTYVCFFRSDEDMKGRVGNGPTADVWNGTRRKVYEE
jgi:UDP-2,3-diacylglucosamine pyrophosphatase LpxH